MANEHLQPFQFKVPENCGILRTLVMCAHKMKPPHAHTDMPCISAVLAQDTCRDTRISQHPARILQLSFSSRGIGSSLWVSGTPGLRFYFPSSIWKSFGHTFPQSLVLSLTSSHIYLLLTRYYFSSFSG